MNKDNMSRIGILKGITSECYTAGVWNHNSYMHGLLNGMILSIGILEQIEPKFPKPTGMGTGLQFNSPSISNSDIDALINKVDRELEVCDYCKGKKRLLPLPGVKICSECAQIELGLKKTKKGRDTKDATT